MTHCQPSLKISCKSVRKFLRKVAKTNRQTKDDENISSLVEVISVAGQRLLMRSCSGCLQCMCMSNTPSSPEVEPRTRAAHQTLRRPLITVSRVPSISDARPSIAASEPSGDPGSSYLGLRSASLLGASSTDDDRRLSNVTTVSSLTPSYRSQRGSDASSVALTTEQGASLLQLSSQQPQQQQHQQRNLLMPPTSQLRL